MEGLWGWRERSGGSVSRLGKGVKGLWEGQGRILEPVGRSGKG